MSLVKHLSKLSYLILARAFGRSEILPDILNQSCEKRCKRACVLLSSTLLKTTKLPLFSCTTDPSL